MHSHTRLRNPVMTNEARQEASTTSQATSGGVSAFPPRANVCVMPWANPRRSLGNHMAIARVAVGNAAPSPKPRTSRAAKSEAKPLTAPVMHGGHGNYRTAKREGKSRAETVAYPATDDLENRVENGEGRKNETNLRVAKMKIRFDEGRGGGDVDPIDVQDQVHGAQQTENNGGYA